MGGSIGFGVRWKDKCGMREVYMDRWTNDLPWRICSPEFINQGKELNALVKEAKPDNEWPNSVLLKSIQRCEYGCVLVDFPSMEIFSRNDYCSAMQMTLATFSSAFKEELEIMRWHIRNGSVGSIMWHPCRDGFPASVDVTPEEWVKEEQIITSVGFCMPTFTSFKVDQKSERRPPAKEVLNWCKAHGWKMPVRWSNK